MSNTALERGRRHEMSTKKFTMLVLWFHKTNIHTFFSNTLITFFEWYKSMTQNISEAYKTKINNN
jgi:hypothetical protein